ncbi:universal stress protein [Danxiaibacter flavus]|uniref:Universal stress protein n=1 Tax=Danxiaibacter flavus TaxID=3049108 RepID=A0ABV3Z8B3_9BACT|nr:universal stress protein [Chitinophagaceae bacterium DXS]
MKTILVPTDFSDVARNASEYAVQLANQIGATKLIFYNAYQVPVVVDAMVAPVELIGVDEIRKSSEENIQNFIEGLKERTNSGTLVFEAMSEFNLLSENIDDICKELNVDLIVMGVTGGGKAKEVLIGSTTISVAKNTNVPVVIVPAEATYTPIKQIVLACDFKKVVETTPIEPIKLLLDTTKAKLLVLNIDHEQKKFTADTPFESLMLDTLLQGYNPEYYFVDNPDFTEGINNFVLEKHADIIITIPKKHGLFDSLFRRSHTKMLAFHSHVPLMVIHE